jgi:hypothetical protein
VKDRTVTFKRRNSADEERTDFNAITNSNSSCNEDMVTLSGQIIKIDPEVHITKYDNVLQQKIEKHYRTAILANGTGAVIVMIWEKMSDNVSPNQYNFFII